MVDTSLHTPQRPVWNQKMPPPVDPSVDPYQAKKTKGLAGANLLTLVIFGAAGRNRTHDPLVRSQVLYPAELQPRSLRL
jgi:hypothetical protein